MLRYGFVPYRRDGNTLLIVVSDPSDLQTIDEVGVQLGTPIRVCVGTASSIQNILKKSESSTRVLEEATEGFQIQILREDEAGEENLTVEKLTSDAQPGHPARRLDGLHGAAAPRVGHPHRDAGRRGAREVPHRRRAAAGDAARSTSGSTRTIISRIKVMAELDIAEKRVPQDGRFKLRVRGKAIDFRVSIMPSVHGEDAVIRILDKESISEQFTELKLDILGWPEEEMRRFRKYIREPYGMVLVTGPDRQRQDDDALRRALGDQDGRRQDRDDRGPGRVPAARASRRFRSTRRRG